MRYQTGNPVEPNGSSDPRDLYDNAANLDLATNGDGPLWTDRLGKSRKSWAGMEQDFNSFLANSQFEYPPLNYVDGTPLTVSRETQIIVRGGQLYRVRLPANFPVSLTGTWATDEALLNPMSDTVLRQDLANAVDPSQGSARIGRGDQVVNSIAELRALLKSSPSKYATVCGYYAAGDGGGGLYYLDASDTTSVDNGGTVIVASDGGRWKLNHSGSVSIKQFGARGNWNGSTGADDTVAIQAAVRCGVRDVWVPPLVAGFAYQTTAKITVDQSIRLHGAGVEPYSVLNTTTGNTRGNGSWFHLNHSGVGFEVKRAVAGFTGVEFERIGTCRTHTIPGGVTVFTPTVYDWDFLLNDAGDTQFTKVCTLNPYKALRVENGQQGRVWINELFGQPLNMGIMINDAYDVIRVQNVHFWPYWAPVRKVYDYQLANYVAARVARCDNASFLNFFSIFHFIGMHVIGNGFGSANKLRTMNTDLDVGAYGLFVDTTAVAHTAYHVNFSSQGGDSAVTAANIGVFVQAQSCDIDLVNLDLQKFNGNAVRIEGQYCRVGVVNPKFADWNLAANSYPAFDVAANSVVTVSGAKRYSVTNAAPVYAGSGKFNADMDSGNAAGTTNASGDITVTHNGQGTPTFIDIELNSLASITHVVTSKNATSFTVRFFTSNTGVALASTAINFLWRTYL